MYLPAPTATACRQAAYASIQQLKKEYQVMLVSLHGLRDSLKGDHSCGTTAPDVHSSCECSAAAVPFKQAILQLHVFCSCASALHGQSTCQQLKPALHASCHLTVLLWLWGPSSRAVRWPERARGDISPLHPGHPRCGVLWRRLQAAVPDDRLPVPEHNRLQEVQQLDLAVRLPWPGPHGAEVPGDWQVSSSRAASEVHESALVRLMLHWMPAARHSLLPALLLGMLCASRWPSSNTHCCDDVFILTHLMCSQYHPAVQGR